MTFFFSVKREIIFMPLLRYLCAHKTVFLMCSVFSTELNQVTPELKKKFDRFATKKLAVKGMG